jgi:hypothetical protein
MSRHLLKLDAVDNRTETCSNLWENLCITLEQHIVSRRCSCEIPYALFVGSLRRVVDKLTRVVMPSLTILRLRTALNLRLTFHLSKQFCCSMRWLCVDALEKALLDFRSFLTPPARALTATTSAKTKHSARLKNPGKTSSKNLLTQ